MRICVLVACYNRRETTLQFLSKMSEAFNSIETADIEIYLLDDGSSDGTSDAVSEYFPTVNLVQGTGSLFWNGGMCKAYRASQQAGDFDAYLLANDDVVLLPDVVKQFVERYCVIQESESAVLVGATLSSKDDMVTYSGFRRGARLRATQFVRVLPTGGQSVNRCDTFNANFVLIPGRDFNALGGLDNVFRHGYGDLDLGLRLKARGVPSYVFGSPIGYCDQGLSQDLKIAKLSRVDRMRSLFIGVYGLRPYVHFIWRHSEKVLVPMFVLRSIGSRAYQVMK